MIVAEKQQQPTCHETSAIKRMIQVTKESVQPPSAEASQIAFVGFHSFTYAILVLHLLALLLGIRSFLSIIELWHDGRCSGLFVVQCIHS